MATPPTFSAGAVLTAAQMNAVGLWEIKSQTIGTTVTSVEVTGAFSADYENYLITISGGTSTTDDNGRLTLGAANTAYYGIYQYATYAAPGTYAGVADNNAVRWSFAWRANTTSLDGYIILRGPFLAEQTFITAANTTTSLGGTFQGLLNDTTSYTSFTIATTTGTLTGGTIRVYGFRN